MTFFSPVASASRVAGRKIYRSGETFKKTAIGGAVHSTADLEIRSDLGPWLPTGIRHIQAALQVTLRPRGTFVCYDKSLLADCASYVFLNPDGCAVRLFATGEGLSWRLIEPPSVKPADFDEIGRAALDVALSEDPTSDDGIASNSTLFECQLCKDYFRTEDDLCDHLWWKTE
jgi:hypothetical protein